MMLFMVRFDLQEEILAQTGSVVLLDYEDACITALDAIDAVGQGQSNSIEVVGVLATWGIDTQPLGGSECHSLRWPSLVVKLNNRELT